MVAIVLLCTVLFAEEVGIPLPVPGELTLIAAGLLIATGGLDPWLFVPLAIASCLAGSITGYSWARLVGEHGLRAVADKLHQTKRLDKVKGRLQKAGPREIAVSRLIPGLRVYTTLAAGAAGVERQTFLIGVAPATVVWVVVFLVVGVVAGVPAERFLGQLEGLILQGGILIALGLGSYLAIRRVPEHGFTALARLPSNLRALLAAGVDMALVGAVVAGVLAVVRPLTPVGEIAGWLDILVVAVVIAVFYSITTRAGRHATAGETLLDASYLTQRAPEASRLSLRSAARVLLDRGAPPSRQDVGRAAQMFRALGDDKRLQLARLLLSGDQSLDEITGELKMSPLEAAYGLRELQTAGVVLVRETEAAQRYSLASDHVRIAVAELLAEAPAAPVDGAVTMTQVAVPRDRR
ncbi:MAG: VTT domain-containing protein [Candidatus Dormibacteraeota bacterium]|nr:VTT domain-containing protein [Candidatus Dormibacteraeota bacterium]